MTAIETLARPLTLILLIGLVLSMGYALRIAGPITLTIPHVEIQPFSLHIGNSAAPTKPPKAPIPHKHHNSKAAHREGGTFSAVPSPGRED